MVGGLACALASHVMVVIGRPGEASVRAVMHPPHTHPSDPPPGSPQPRTCPELYKRKVFFPVDVHIDHCVPCTAAVARAVLQCMLIQLIVIASITA